jgi:precorrin-6A/cobalt-precorrin-6A reductase
VILLLGGTSETAPIASSLAGRGFRVLVSTATEIPLHVGHNKRISKRSGPLEEEGLLRILREEPIRAVVDATHPYAGVITGRAREATQKTGVPFFRFSRPGTMDANERVHLAPDHGAAAKAAFGFGRPVLLTIGSRNLSPYAEASRSTGPLLVVRVLPTREATEACQKAGIPPDRIIAAKGPFSLGDNLDVIRKRGIGVLVTKDSGKAGGVPQKMEAARLTGCDIVVLTRPAHKETGCEVFSDIAHLTEAVFLTLGAPHRRP